MPGRRRRLFIGSAAFAIVVGLLAPGPLRVSASTTLLCPTPQVTGVSPQVAAPGQQVTVTGQNLAPAGFCPNEQVTVGGTPIPTFSPAPDGSSLTFQVPKNQVVDGPVQVTIYRDGLGANPSNADIVFVTQPTGTVTFAPHVGQPVGVSGSNLDVGGFLAGPPVLTLTPIAGSCPSTLTATQVSSSALAFPGLNAYCASNPTVVAMTVYATTEAQQSRNLSQTFSVTVPVGPIDVAAQVTSVSPTVAAAGSAVTVQGSGFGSAGSAFVGSDRAQVSRWTDRSVSLVVPDTAVSKAALVLVRSPDFAGIGAGTLEVVARIDSVAPTAAAVGDAVTLSGGGFGSTPGTVQLGSVSLPVTSWSPTSITVTVADGATSGALVVAPAQTDPPTTRPTLTIVPKLLGITPSHVVPGGVFEISGTSFGQPTSGDAVTVGGAPATVTLWGDHQIVVTTPPSLAPGRATVVVTVAGAPAPLSASIVVDPAPTPTPGKTPTATSAPLLPRPGGPIVSQAPAPFRKPPHPDGPVALTLTPATDAASPGQEVALTVRIVAFGKPVVGAPVQFLMVYEPGTDASVSPASAVTDGNGIAHAVLHLSRTPGDHIVLARSGTYSDEIRVVARRAGERSRTTSLLGTTVSGGLSGPTRLLAAGAMSLCLVLFLTGFALQVRSRGWIGRPGGRRQRGLASLVAQGATAGATVVGVGLVLGASIVGRLANLVRRS